MTRIQYLMMPLVLHVVLVAPTGEYYMMMHPLLITPINLFFRFWQLGHVSEEYEGFLLSITNIAISFILSTTFAAITVVLRLL